MYKLDLSPPSKEDEFPLLLEASPFGSPYESSFPPSFHSPNRQEIKILLLENISSNAIEKLRDEDYQVEVVNGSISKEEVLKKIESVHVLGVRSRTIVDSEILDRAKNLLCIGCFCIGTDKVNISAALQKGIPVFNSPYQNSRSVAELIIGQIISLSRQLGERNLEMHNSLWKKSSNDCFEVRGKVLGIVGYGHIGSQVSVLAEALGMNVIFYDILSKMPLGNSKSTPDLSTLLKNANFVTLHVPELPSTRNFIAMKEIMMMKKGSYLLNASRGSVVCISDLIKCLKSNHLAGAYLDVYPKEPLKNGTVDDFDELASCHNLIMTPHIGGSTVEAQEAIGEEVSQRISSFLNTGSTHGSVNFPQLDLAYAGKGSHRIINVHQNRPGVLKEINNILSIYNVEGQALKTHKNVGYFITDVDQKTSDEIFDRISSVKYSVKTRLLY